MQERQAALRGVTRRTIRPDPALLVILIDELAALAFDKNRDVRRRVEYALGPLLSQRDCAFEDVRRVVVPVRWFL